MEPVLKLHVRPALRNGITIEELRALLLQTAIYAGVSATNAAFRWVNETSSDELALDTLMRTPDESVVEVERKLLCMSAAAPPELSNTFCVYKMDRTEVRSSAWEEMS